MRTADDRSFRLTRREALAFAGALAASAAVPVSLRAAEPISIGDAKVTTFSDGHLTIPAAMLASNLDVAGIRAAGVDVGDTNRSPLNVTYLEIGSDKILVDVGSGANFMPTAGKLAESLKAAGVDPEGITKVIYTHAHPDHMWGTVNDFDELSFPNASYHISEAEQAYWTADDILTKLPEDRHAFAAGAQRNMKAIGDKLALFKPGQEIVTGLTAIDTAGHTMGHVSLRVAGGWQNLVILGDALSHPVISFEHPDWKPVVDTDKDLAVATRKRLLAELAAEKSLIIGYHLPEPGAGRVEAKGSGFRFVTA